jgi:hypothetical protein
VTNRTHFFEKKAETPGASKGCTLPLFIFYSTEIWKNHTLKYQKPPLNKPRNPIMGEENVARVLCPKNTNNAPPTNYRGIHPMVKQELTSL